MSGGVYNQTFFNNHPWEKEKDGILYGIVLVNMQTWVDMGRHGQTWAVL